MRLVLFGFLIGLVCLLLFLLLSYISPLYKKTTPQNLPENPTALLTFDPEIISISCKDSSASAAIKLQTNSSDVSSAQIELQYNPQIFYNFSITQDSQIMEKQIALKNIREEYGRASLVIDFENNATYNERIAEVSFSIYPQTSSSSSQITFLNKSAVLQQSSRQSILSSTQPLTIYCQPEF